MRIGEIKGMSAETKKNHDRQMASKSFMTGTATDERTIKNSLKFLGIILIVFVIAFIACASATFDSIILRLLMNSAVIILSLYILYNNGSRCGAEDVARGEILWQKQEKGLAFSESERKMCFHPMKGYLIGLFGSALLLLPAVILSFCTSVQTTASGTLPSWMQAYVKRSDIGNALINYTQPSGMQFVDYIRAFVRVSILPFVNIIGSDNKIGLMILERLGPIILLLPSAAYGTGYISGRSVRKRIHTVITENDKKRIRKEQKKRKTGARRNISREPEKLN